MTKERALHPKISDSRRAMVWFFCAALLLFLLYRFFIMLCYSFRYLDCDQALMWYGTAEFAHLKFREPCFFGQAYGTMLESLLAVPLYLIGVPLNFALPLSTLLLAIGPLLYISIKAIRHDRMELAFWALFVFAFMSWQWDVITSVPRSLLCGFAFALVGGVMINEPGHWTKAACGAFLAILGFLFTSTSITLIGIAGLALILYNKWDRALLRRLCSISAGAVPGLLVYWAVKSFYRTHPHYNLHQELSFTYGVETLTKNLLRLRQIAGWFTPANCGIVLLAGLTVLLLFLFLKRRYRAFAMSFCAVFGSLAFLGVDKINDYAENSILYSQLRMLLFVPFLAVLTVYLIGSNEKKASSVICHKDRLICGLFLAIVLSILPKWLAFGAEMKKADSSLFHDDVVSCVNVSTVAPLAEEISQAAKDHDCDVVIHLNYKEYGYACSAINYGEYTSFICGTYPGDRRTWIYEKMFVPDDHRCLLVTVQGGKMQAEVVELQDESVVRWIEDHYGFLGGRWKI